jgi:hypothetical protein
MIVGTIMGAMLMVRHELPTVLDALHGARGLQRKALLP